MNCQKLKNNFAKITSKCSLLIFAFLISFYVTNNSYSQSCPPAPSTETISTIENFYQSYSMLYPSIALPAIGNCATKVFAEGETPQPGNNCLFDGKPLCTVITNPGYSIPSGNIYSSPTLNDHRTNCNDLADLPLCDLFLQDQRKPGLNCAQNCNSSTFNNPDPLDPSNIRGETYAVHNRDCVRFCDEVDEENTDFGSSIVASEGQNCIVQRCNQLELDGGMYPEKPIDGTNCNILSCNLLYPQELADVYNKTYYNNYNYCNGQTDQNNNNRPLKCYHFSEDQIKYLIPGTTCQVHNCKPSCGDSYNSSNDVNSDGVVNSYDDDDTRNIKADYYDSLTHYNRALDGTTATPLVFESYYKNYVNSCNPIDNDFICKPVTCQPIAKRYYICKGDNRDEPNSECGSSVEESTCVNSYCYKLIDCNKSSNSDEKECKAAPSEGGSGTTSDEGIESWLHRPKPLKKATEKISGSNVMRPEISTSNLCYTTQDMKDIGWGGNFIVDLGLGFEMDYGYFHTFSHLPSRSPGHCEARRDFSRGKDYIYLCYGEEETGGAIYQKISDETAYHRGYVDTTYLANGDAEHVIEVCLRFRNGFIPGQVTGGESCGARQCYVSCAFDICDIQYCGEDVCRTLKVRDSDPNQCKMSNKFFASHGDPDDSMGGSGSEEEPVNIDDYPCAKEIDFELRLRAQKYGNKICSFLDVLKHNATDTEWFARGSETVTGNYCIAGHTNTQKPCDGLDTTQKPDSTYKWRTIRFSDDVHIPYIQDNQPDSSKFKGYVDVFDQFHPKQDCIKVPLRVSGARYYNLANSVNTPRLFTPPAFINYVMTKKGGIISRPLSLEDKFGPTDFNFPELEVKFGDVTERLSLDIGVTGHEFDELSYPNGLKTIETTIKGVTYDKTFLVRKEYSRSKNQPLFCLYEQIKDVDGNYLPPLQIECVNRKKPDIDNIIERFSDPYLAAQKAVVSANPENTYDDSKIWLQYLNGYGANGNDNRCQNDDICSPIIELSNPDVDKTSCHSETEQYEVCSKRDKCSKLYNECINNEIAIFEARKNSDPYDSLAVIRDQCNLTLLPECNAKRGISAGGTVSDFNEEEQLANKHPEAYGWFNEICITKGFEDKLKTIVAYDYDDIYLGKCIIDVVNSPYENDDDPNTNCDLGGRAPNCLCVEAVEGLTPSPGMKLRTQTPREAGLCIDIPSPEMCPAITYNPTANPDNPNLDPDYTSSSLGFTSYGTNAVHPTHKDRKNDIYQSGHADFPDSIMGMNEITGSCKGFWQEINSLQKPIKSCLDLGGEAKWNISTINSCIRYSCPAITTSGPTDKNFNTYQNGYASGEVGEEKGQSEGFATWPKYEHDDDFAQTINATGCIHGFKRQGATPLYEDLNDSTKITSYSGGVNPQRVCDQIGDWRGIVSSSECERIMCPAINPPADPGSDPDKWAQWEESGGATFAEVLASRAKINFVGTDDNITAGSTRYGVCNNSLGYFQLGSPPERSCDYLGNWGEVKNACTTECSAVDQNTGNSLNHGYATWPDTNASTSQNLVEATGSCIIDHVPYPYSSLTDSTGKPFALVANAADADYVTTIPQNEQEDTRSINSQPTRLCEWVDLPDLPAGGISLWNPAASKCIKRCPSGIEPDTIEEYPYDPRINVGITRHNTTAGSIEVQWPSAALGTWVYYNGDNFNAVIPNFNGQNVRDYSSQNRTNGLFMIARECKSNGKWGDVIPQCVVNGRDDFGNYDVNDLDSSIIGTNAIYENNGSHSESRTIDVNSTDRAKPISCMTDLNYYPNNSDTGTPDPVSEFKCSYSNSNENIDQTYFEYVSGSSCSKYCKADMNTSFGGSTASYFNSASLQYFTPTTTIDLTCSSGFGHKISGPGSGADTSCGRTSLDRTDNLPTVTCETDGSWSSVLNQCDQCRECVCKESGPCPESGIFIEDTDSEKFVIPWSYGDCSGDTDVCFVAGSYSREEINDAGQKCGNSGDDTKKLYPGTVQSGSYKEENRSACGQSREVTYKFQCYDKYFRVYQTDKKGDVTSLRENTI